MEVPAVILEEAMLHLVRPVALVVVLSLTTAVSVTHAQFGSLKKKAAATAVQAAGIPTTPPTYVKSTTITAAELKQLNTGLSAMIAKVPTAKKEYEQAAKKLERETQDYEKAKAEYDKKAASYNACVERVSAVESARRDTLQAKVDQSLEANQMNQSQEDQMVALAAKAQAAAERVSNGTATAADRQTLAEFQKVMAGVSASSQQAISAMKERSAADPAAAAHLDKECGKPPVEPTPPEPAPSSADDVVNRAGVAAAGRGLHTWVEHASGYIRTNTVAQAGGGMTEQQAADFNSELKKAADLMAQLDKLGYSF